MDKTHFRQHRMKYGLAGGFAVFIVLLIWINMLVSTGAKITVSIMAIVILACLVGVVYNDATKDNKTPAPTTPTSPPVEPRTPMTPTVPPKPTRPPRSLTTLYDHRPRPVPEVGYTVLATLILVLLCVSTINANGEVSWTIVIVYALVASIFCYWQWIKWRGRYLIITKERKELQSVLPWPFVTHAPSMPNTAGAAQDVRRTFLDRLFGTCRLFSDIKAEGDEVFHNLKWLPYPAELRAALGLNPIRRNSWWFFQRK